MHRPLLSCLLAAAAFTLPASAQKSVKVFILAGDENLLRQGSIDGTPREPGKKGATPAEPRDLPGTLLTLLKKNPRFSFLRDTDGKWAKRNDVALYDAHPLSNNTRDPARLLQVPSDAADPRGYGVGRERVRLHDGSSPFPISDKQGKDFWSAYEAAAR